MKFTQTLISYNVVAVVLRYFKALASRVQEIERVLSCEKHEIQIPDGLAKLGIK